MNEKLKLPQGFSAGFAREVVNPLPGTSLGGWATASKRWSEAILDDIKVTCTALSDGDTVFLLYSNDALYVRDKLLDQVTEILTEKFSIPAENVIMNATHSHSAPIIHYPNMKGMPEYMSRFLPAVIRTAENAILDLAPAEIYAGRAKTQDLNHVRRYVSRVDGSYLGGSALPKGQDPTKVRHETEADNEMQILRFVRKEKKDIVLCNWQCHCTTNSGQWRTDVSADWVAPFRDAMERDYDVHFSYHQGAAGNLVPGTKIEGEKSNRDYIAHGEELAKVAAEAMKNAVLMKSGKFCAFRKKHTAVHKPEYREKEKVGETDSFYLNALSIGDVAFTTAPCEWHDTCGKQVKEGSPYPMTFVCAYSNGVVSYIPADFAFDNGGYEVKMCHFVRGTGEEIALDLISMLKQIQKGE